MNDRSPRCSSARHCACSRIGLATPCAQESFGSTPASGYQRLGEPEQFAGPGEMIFFRAGEAHRFWNAGVDELRCTGYIEPADNVEYRLTEIFASARRRGGGQPGLFGVAFLARRYRSEYAMLAVPQAVQRFAFPVLAAVGRLLGKYRKYRDAPEPVRRRAAPRSQGHPFSTCA